MSAWFQRLQTGLVLVLLSTLIVGSLPDASFAQSGEPEPTPRMGEPEELDEATPEEASGLSVLTDAAGNPVYVESDPDNQPALAEAAAEDDDDGFVRLEQTQGFVTLSITVTQRFRAGDPITYTYAYRNTSATETASNVILEATWTDYANNGANDRQYCSTQEGAAYPCTLLSFQGPEVTKMEDVLGGMRFQIGTLEPGAAGQFRVVLGTLNTINPVFDVAPVQLAGSGKLFANNEAVPISENTVDTLPIGPIFTASKVVNTDSLPANRNRIFAGETVAFTITINNAPREIDQNRADVTDATDVIVRDFLPNGSAFVTPTIVPDYPFVYDDSQRVVYWFIDSLAIGESIEIPVTFLQLDSTAACRQMDNRLYDVTSSEMPLRNDSTEEDVVQTRAVGGSRAQVDVQVPLSIGITAEPNRVDPGDTAILTFVARNTYPERIENLELVYDIQTSGYYITDTATPEPSTYPRSDTPGERIIWTFDISGTDNLNEPSEVTFQTTISTTIAGDDRGFIQFNTTEDTTPFPSACLEGDPVQVRVNRPEPEQDRLNVLKESNVEERQGDVGLIDQGQRVTYRLELTNTADRPIIINVVDTFPQNNAARFTYVDGSAQPPITDRTSEGGGGLFWNNLTIPAHEENSEPFIIQYDVEVEGQEYFDLCNRMEIQVTNSGGANIRIAGDQEFCVKIEPDVTIQKTADQEEAVPGEEVRFTLSLRNDSNQTYFMGLADMLTQFEFVRVDPDNTYGDPPEQIPDTSIWTWDLVEVPPGGRVDASFYARIPDSSCERDDYVNEIAFLFRSALTGEDYVVIQRPPVIATVRCINRLVTYSQQAAVNETSLGSRFTYEGQIRNQNTVEPVNNLEVDFILPRGFSYDGPSTRGNTTERPEITTLDTGQQQLTWIIPTINADSRFTLAFVARAGSVVGPQQSLMQISAPNVSAVCDRVCQLINEESYAASVVEVKALHTAEPRLIIPSEQCLAPGEPLTYALSLVNTNSDVEYGDTTVIITLSLGLRYTGLITDVNEFAIRQEPERSVDNEGRTVLQWSDLTIRSPNRGRTEQRDFYIGLAVGQVLEDLRTQVSVTSADGLIPLKEDAVNPEVDICDDPGTTSAVVAAKEANPIIAAPGDEVFYQISFANTNNFPVTLNVQETLPEAFGFLNMVDTSDVQTPPTQNAGNQLVWNGVNIPAANGLQAGIVNLRFRVQIAEDAAFATYGSNTRILDVSPEVDIDDALLNQLSIVVASDLPPTYLPLVRKE